MSEPVKRRYDGAGRRRRAQLNRDRILDAALALFTQSGYAATTIEAIAAQAGVAVPTVYAAFRNRAGLVARLRERALSGDDAPEPLADRAWYRALVDSDEPVGLLRGFARHTRRIYDALAPVLQVVRDAAGSDPEVAALRQAEDVERRIGMTPIAEALHRLDAVRPDYTAEETADLLWTVGGPEAHRMLVIDRGWSPDRYERWLADTLCATLLGSSGDRYSIR